MAPPASVVLRDDAAEYRPEQQDPIMNIAFSFRRALSVAALALGTAPLAHAYPWTSTGSTGMPDESALATDTIPAKIVLSGPYVSLLASPAPGSAVIRYNVTAVFDKNYLFTPSLEMRFLDNSATTRIYGALRAYNTDTGASRTLATLDSNSFAASSSYQTQISCSPNNLWFNDFSKEVYYVEVTLSRTSTAGSAALAALRVDECVW